MRIKFQIKIISKGKKSQELFLLSVRIKDIVDARNLPGFKGKLDKYLEKESFGGY